jgi:hypothetical protein
MGFYAFLEDLLVLESFDAKGKLVENCGYLDTCNPIGMVKHQP